MKTPGQRRIDDILDDEEPEKDRSLRGQALRRATADNVPRTLTAWEWEEWYANHGVPASHRGKPHQSCDGKSFGDRFVDCLAAIKQGLKKP